MKLLFKGICKNEQKRNNIPTYFNFNSSELRNIIYWSMLDIVHFFQREWKCGGEVGGKRAEQKFWNIN